MNVYHEPVPHEGEFLGRPIQGREALPGRILGHGHEPDLVVLDPALGPEFLALFWGRPSEALVDPVGVELSLQPMLLEGLNAEMGRAYDRVRVPHWGGVLDGQFALYVDVGHPLESEVQFRLDRPHIPEIPRVPDRDDHVRLEHLDRVEDRQHGLVAAALRDAVVAYLPAAGIVVERGRLLPLGELGHLLVRIGEPPAWEKLVPGLRQRVDDVPMYASHPREQVRGVADRHDFQVNFSVSSRNPVHASPLTLRYSPASRFLLSNTC